MKLIFATNNKHKFREASEILNNEMVEICGLSDIDFFEELPENQETLEGNALEKAFFVYNKTGINCFSDDTGLEIEALNGEPGVYSARYAGKGCNFVDNMNKVLKKLQNQENRKARFITIIALILNGKKYLFEGEVRGEILNELRGTGGFGYDPIFKPDGFERTFAEMSLSEKNRISHRGKAFTEFLNFIKQNPYFFK